MITLNKIKIRHFRLLNDVELEMEPTTTLVVGRNNSGKTSLSEVVRRFLHDSSPVFRLEDFSSICFKRFCDALQSKNANSEEPIIRGMLPFIELSVSFRYDANIKDLGALSDFVVDLNPACTEALVIARYELKDGKIDDFFEGFPTTELKDDARRLFVSLLKERIPELFEVKVWAQDPNDATNQKSMSVSSLRSVLRTGFVNAQRGLDDTTSKDTDVLSRVLETLFNTASSPSACQTEKQTAADLEDAVRQIQEKLDTDFNGKLKGLLPTLATFGYPGLDGSEIATETTLDVRRLLSNHTRVRYVGQNGILYPEAYNGLGIRNLIFILLQIVSFYRAFRAEKNAPGVVLVFVEEPEAHLHPQMQEVFIRQLSQLAHQLNAQGQAEGNADLPWPVQFVVSTHSSHVANASRFEAIRYFLASAACSTTGTRETKVKDLRQGLIGTSQPDRDFLHQYLTLTRCDLFFADKAILVEGLAERILFPVIVQQQEDAAALTPKLSTQYITIMEVGGAYAHLFFPLLEFLELKTLVITDIDSVGDLNEKGKRKACPVNEGKVSSNTCINTWFSPVKPALDAVDPTVVDDGKVAKPSIEDLLKKSPQEKRMGVIRIAYQHPESDGGPCGRTFEDSFMLANAEKFEIPIGSVAEMESVAFEAVKGLKKSDFALKHAIDDTEWKAPTYVIDGLKWLAVNETVVSAPTGAEEIEIEGEDVAEANIPASGVPA